MNIDFKTEIKKRGLKQRFIAQQLQIADNTFANKLNGRYRFTAEELIKLAKILNINLNKFKEA